MLQRLRRPLATLIACAALAPGLALADFPDRPIRMIIPYPPGASTDTMGRLLADHMSRTLGQHVIVENRGGASGTIGSATVAKAEPDGYTIGMGTDGSHATVHHLMKQPPYDPVKDFTPLTLAVKNIIVLVGNPKFEPQNVAELIEYAKKNPGELAYGSSGLGSPHFLAGLLLNQMADIDMLHVPYKGGNPAVVDAIGGQIPLVFSSMASVEPHIRSGALKAYGVTELERYHLTPDIPTVAESLPGFEMTSWLAFFGPAGMPEAVVNKLNEALVAAIKDPENAKKLQELGLEPVASSAQEFAELLPKDAQMRGELIRAAGLEAE